MMSALLLSTLIAVDLQGRFHGTLPMQGAGPDVVLRFEQVQSDILAWFTSMDMGRSEMPVPQVHTSDDGVHLNVLLGDSSLQLVATIDGDDVVLTNADTQATTRLARLAPLGPHVVWGGDLPAASGDLQWLTLRLPEAGTSRLDLPADRFWDHPVDVERQEDGTFGFALGDGAQVLVTPVGDVAPGMLLHRDKMHPVTLHKGATTGPAHPQHPVDPVPWTATEGTVELHLEHTLQGELIAPETPTRTIVLLMGGRDSDRDHTTQGHKPLLVLADTLAGLGVASLRLDPPGVGASAPLDPVHGDMTWSLWSLQLSGIVEQLRESGDWDDVYLMGIGDGAMSALMTAARAREQVAGVVLLSPPALPRAVIEAEQMRRLLVQRGASADAAAAVVDARQEFIRLALERVNDDALRQAARAWLTALAELTGGGSPGDAAVELQLQGVKDPAKLRDLAEEPRRYLPRITAPVLAIWGRLDEQLDTEAHKALTVAAVQRLGGTIEAHVVERATATLGPAPAPGRRNVRRTFLPETLAIIKDWMTIESWIAPAAEGASP